MHHPYGPSQLPRIALCPGSIAMTGLAISEGLCPSDDTDAAEEGTSCHAATKPGVSLDGFNSEQRFAIEKAREYAAAKLEGATKVLYEETMVLWDADNEPVTWGTTDLIGIYPSLIRIIDNKFGRIPITRDGVELQMRSYAGAGMQQFGVNRAEVWVYQPREDTEFFGQYGFADAIAEEIGAIIRIAEAHPEMLRPSATACRYCKGKTRCPEFREEVLNLLPTTQKTLALLDPSKVAKALEFAQLVEPWAKSVRDHARKLLENGTEIPGWTLGTRNVRQASDLPEIFETVSDVLSQKAFLECCDVRIGDLEDTYGRKWKEKFGNGATIKAGKERFKEETKSAIATVTQHCLKRKE